MNERLEIDSRITPDIEVNIWYLPEHEICILSLVERARNREVEFAVEPDKVSDALQHPWFYASQQGTEMPLDPLEVRQ